MIIDRSAHRVINTLCWAQQRRYFWQFRRRDLWFLFNQVDFLLQWSVSGSRSVCYSCCTNKCTDSILIWFWTDPFFCLVPRIMSRSVSGMVGRCVARTVRAAAKVPYYVLDTSNETGDYFDRVAGELGDPACPDLCKDSNLILEAVLYCQDRGARRAREIFACLSTNAQPQF